MLPYHSEAFFFEMQEKKYNWLASHPKTALALFAVIAIESAISPLILSIAKTIECIALGCFNGFGAMLGMKDCLNNCLESLSIICVVGEVIFSPIFAVSNLFGLLFFPEKFTVKASNICREIYKLSQEIYKEKRGPIFFAGAMVKNIMIQKLKT